LAPGEKACAAINLESVASFENLYIAYKKAARGKMNRHDVALFSMQWETSLLALKDLLLQGSYQPCAYRLFTVHEKKPRQIMAAPFVDRIVHHAICNVLNPVLERSMHPNSCANRLGKGTSFGLKLFSRYIRNHSHVLMCDIRNFFPSIDRTILFELLRKKVPDRGLVDLIQLLLKTPPQQDRTVDYFWGDTLLTPVERSKGLPIGNMTSQTWANWYLNGLDHFVTSCKGFGAYVRYVDDFAIFGNDKKALNRLKAGIQEFLEGLRLRIHPAKSRVYKTTDGISFLGFKHYPSYRILKKENIRRFKKRVRAELCLYKQGLLAREQYLSSIAGWCGHARMGDTYDLRKTLYHKIHAWNRGLSEWTPCSAWGLLEQQPEQPALREPQQEQSEQPEQQCRFSMCPARETAGVRPRERPERAFLSYGSVPGPAWAGRMVNTGGGTAGNGVPLPGFFLHGQQESFA
jgi:RNA-directed DNA polymerase